MDQEILNTRVKKAIGISLFDDENADISYIFRETKSLIAGGFILNAINETQLVNTDLDIYVNLSNAKRLLNIFTDELELKVSLVHTSPAYDQSFFKKNNILERIALDQYHIHKVDIMVIPDHIDVKTVVQNFDLTFCEIWYDGVNVAGTNIEDSLNKKGYLREQYRESLLVYFNKFIINRIKKYLKRGYSIDYNCDIGNIKTKLDKKTVITGEDWLISKIYEAMIATQNPGGSYYSIVKKKYAIWAIDNPLTEKTWRKLEEIANMTGDVEYVENMWKFYKLPYEDQLSPIKKFFLITLFIYPKFSDEFDTQYEKYINDWFGISYKEFVRKIYEFIQEVVIPDESNIVDITGIGNKIKPILASKFALLLSTITDTKLNIYDELDQEELSENCKTILDILDEEDEEDEEEDQDIIRLQQINGEIQQAMRSGDRQKIRELMQEKSMLTTKTQQILEEKRQKKEMKKYKNIDNYTKTDENFVLVLDKDNILCYNTQILEKALLNKNQWLLECEGKCYFKHEFEVYSSPDFEDINRFYDLSDVKEIVKIDNKWILKYFLYGGSDREVYLKPEPPSEITLLDDKNYNQDKFINDTGPGTTEEDCRGDKSMNPVNKEDLYVGIPVDVESKIYIKASILKGIFTSLKEGNKIFFVEQVKGISHTTTYQNALTNRPDWVSTNHCQFGSAIATYTLKIINPELDALNNKDNYVPDMYNVL